MHTLLFRAQVSDSFLVKVESKRSDCPSLKICSGCPWPSLRRSKGRRLGLAGVECGLGPTLLSVSGAQPLHLSGFGLLLSESGADCASWLMGFDWESLC